jgi:hypothetical protein
LNGGAFIFEIARSEIGDHVQTNAKKYNSVGREKELEQEASGQLSRRDRCRLLQHRHRYFQARRSQWVIGSRS